MGKKNILVLNIFLFITLILLISFVSAETTYTAGSDTNCNNGVCTKTLYSGIRNVYEDDTWKRVENARSLKDKGFNIVILEDDEKYPLEVIDFNYTSISVKLNPKGTKVFNEDIPLRIWNNNDTKAQEFEQDVLDGKKESKGIKDYKEKMDRVSEEEISFNSLNQEEEMTLDFGIGKVLEFGVNSTTIKLEDNETENLVDIWTYKTLVAATNERGYMKFNISSISNESILEEAIYVAYAYQSTNFDGDINITFVNNQTWSNNTPIAEIVAFDLGESIQTSSGYCQGVGWTETPDISSLINLSESYFSFSLIDPDYSELNQDVSKGNEEDIRIGYEFTTSHICKLRGIRYSADISLRPYLNITYTIPDTTPECELSNSLILGVLPMVGLIVILIIILSVVTLVNGMLGGRTSLDSISEISPVIIIIASVFIFAFLIMMVIPSIGGC